MTLQDIHKEFDDIFHGLSQYGHKKIHENNHSSHKGTMCSDKCVYVGESIKDFYDKKIIELIKECMPEEMNPEDFFKDEQNVPIAYNSYKTKLIENLKARNINLD